MSVRETRLVFAGHGGQGVVSMAETLGTAATLAGAHCCCHMIYGAEMRGGIVRCYVTIGEGEPTDLVIEDPDGVVCMNQEAWDNVASAAPPGGFVVVNTDLVTGLATAPPGVQVI